MIGNKRILTFKEEEIKLNEKQRRAYNGEY